MVIKKEKSISASGMMYLNVFMNMSPSHFTPN